jgi:hypothetical protein
VRPGGRLVPRSLAEADRVLGQLYSDTVAIIVPTPILEKLYYSIGGLGAAIPAIGLLLLLIMMW